MKWKGVLIFILMFGSVYAQPKKEVRTGNKLYKEGNYKQADEAYGQALIKQPNYIPGLFNLGNSKYKQKDYESARKLMEATSKTASNKEQSAAADYNIGNTFLEEQKYKEAVEAYKEALRKNPQDEQAKYNLSYALEKLKQQNQNNKNDKNKDEKNKDEDKKEDKDKKENQDKNKDEQNKENEDKKDEKGNNDKEDKDKEEQDKKDEQGKGDKEKDKKEQRPQPKPSKISEQQAEQLLNALQQEEKKLQDKMKKGKGVPIKVEKDW